MSDIDTKVHIGGKTLPYPVLVASGTFGYGEEYKHICDYNMLGGIVCKTVTKEARAGNPPPRMQETEAGGLNSIGLANEGMQHFVDTILPLIKTYPCPYIVNIAGKSAEEFLEIIDFISEHDTEKTIWGWELNVSCPNVSQGANFGKNPRDIEKIVRHIRPHTTLPLSVKLPPNVSDIGILGQAAEQGGADAVSACNTYVGMWIDTESRTPVLHRHTGGYSGTGIFPATLALVYELAQKIHIPIIGIGGITHGNHALQYLLAGAKAVQVGMANFSEPCTANFCIEEIIAFCENHKFDSIGEIVLGR